MSGRNRRTCAQIEPHRRVNAAASSLQDQIVADCSDRCRCGIRRSSSQSIEQISVNLDLIDRRDSQSFTRARAAGFAWSACQLRRAGRSAPVTGQIDAGQHDLHAALEQRADLIDHRAHRHRARIAAAVGMMQKVQR